MYDKDNNISITQMEYRTAYKRFLEGRLKILTFIRSEIWTVCEDRKELEIYLRSIEVKPELQSDIASHPSKLAENAKFIGDFISEVRKNKELKESQEKSSELPTGNWIHIFSNFRDIIDGIQTQVFSGLPIEEVTIRRLLESELRTILGNSLIKLSDSSFFSPENCVDIVSRKINFNVSNPINLVAEVKTEHLQPLFLNGLFYIGKKYKTLILQRALESSTFLFFNKESGVFEESQFYIALLKLFNEIELVKMADISKCTTYLNNVFSTLPTPAPEITSLELHLILPLLHFLDRMSNIINLSTALIKHLNGSPFRMPNIRPDSPIPDWNEKLSSSRVTPQDVNNFIANVR